MVQSRNHPTTADGSSGHLLHNLILFGRLLRRLGLDVNPGRMMDLVGALDYIELGRRADFFHASRSLLVHRREDLALFEQAFEMFWQQPVERWKNTLLGGLDSPRSRKNPRIQSALLREGGAAGERNDPEESPPEEPPAFEVNRIYSAREVLRYRDFADLTGDEMEAIQRLISELVWQLGDRRTRRFRRGRGPRFDLRRTLRWSLRHGGEVIHWARREPKTKPRPLVILADISGSMERYTRLLLHFIYGLTRGLEQKVEAFVFSTRLTRISRQMQEHDPERGLAEISRLVPDWSGGTRIGEALKTFNFQWGRRVLGGGAVALLISDGWDRGEPDLLSREIARLRRSSYRLIWLNPLLGSPDYQPLTRGMKAALPYVDDFLPVHNLASLEHLALHLSRLDRKRYARGEGDFRKLVAI